MEGKENQVPAGSVPVGQSTDNNETAMEAPAELVVEQEKQEEVKGPEKAGDDKISKLEKMLNDSKSMIGKQSSEVGALRKQLQELQQAKAEPAGPSLEDQIDVISDQIENGDIGLKEGNRAIAKLSAQMAEQSAMAKFSQQKETERVSTMQQKFLQANPDFEELVNNGVLDSYLEADPMADEYVAYKQYKADERVKALEEEYAAKIAAAKEEGAKLAQGADAAGKVLGKTGSAARATSSAPKPFKNAQDAQNTMLAQLRAMRSAQ